MSHSSSLKARRKRQKNRKLLDVAEGQLFLLGQKGAFGLVAQARAPIAVAVPPAGHLPVRSFSVVASRGRSTAKVPVAHARCFGGLRASSRKSH